MSGNVSIRRRGFLAGALRGAAAAAGFWLYSLPGPAGADQGLTPAQRATLDAVLDTLIPEDEYPGALLAGVPERIQALLAASPRRAALYRRGLDAIERGARDADGRAFGELAPARRGAVLAGYESGFGPGAILFHYVRRDALTAFYSTPQAYAMLGYQPPVNGYPYTAVPPGAPDEGNG